MCLPTYLPYFTCTVIVPGVALVWLCMSGGLPWASLELLVGISYPVTSLMETAQHTVTFEIDLKIHWLVLDFNPYLVELQRPSIHALEKWHLLHHHLALSFAWRMFIQPLSLPGRIYVILSLLKQFPIWQSRSTTCLCSIIILTGGSLYFHLWLHALSFSYSLIYSYNLLSDQSCWFSYSSYMPLLMNNSIIKHCVLELQVNDLWAAWSWSVTFSNYKATSSYWTAISTSCQLRTTRHCAI